MKIEVEQKFRVADAAAMQAELTARGITLGDAETQEDLYFAHPARDFATTDEALRIRRIGSQSFVTYKGPRFDTETKARKELELPLSGEEGADSSFAELLEALGFRQVLMVRKSRRKARLIWQDHEVEIVLDEIDRLGTFAEVEVVANEADFEPARDAVLSLAADLGLTEVERHSYLELLLKRPENDKPLK